MNGKAGTLTILQINDTHGYVEPHPELIWRGREPEFQELGGYARIAGYFASVRTERPDAVLAFDNGDTFHGTYHATVSKGAALVPLVNALKLDAMTAHWEFAWGPEHFMELLKSVDHPMLAINCYETESGKRPFAPSALIERGGLRVGVIGIAAFIIDKTMPPHFSEGLRFTTGEEALGAEIAKLRRDEQVDVVIVLSHLGLPQDIKLAGAVPGIDVLLSGHTHDRLDAPIFVGRTIVIQSGCHGGFVGRLDIRVANGQVELEAHRLVPMDAAIVPDPAMERLVEAVVAPSREELATVVGEIEEPLHRNMILNCPTDDLLLSAIAASAGRSIAFSNGWRYGAPVPAGPITLGDLWNIVPVNPPVMTVEMTGAEIHAMMEENLERTFSADPYGQMSGFVKRFCGLTILAKLGHPAGHRIEAIFADDQRLDPDASYPVAYITAQGVAAKYGRDRKTLDTQAIDALTAYLRDAGRRPALAGRIIAV